MSEPTDSRANDPVFKMLHAMTKGRLVEYCLSRRRELEALESELALLRRAVGQLGFVVQATFRFKKENWEFAEQAMAMTAWADVLRALALLDRDMFDLIKEHEPK